MTYSRILGTGSYLPRRVLTNQDLEKLVETNDQWIRERTGISERRIAAPEETTCDLAEHAAKEALEAAGIKASELDLIIVATTTPDMIFPSTACLLQQRLKVTGSGAFDIQAVCSGFVYGLHIADQFIRNNTARYILLVGAETLSRIIDWHDRDTCILFGDGAGAVVLGRDDIPGILSSLIHANGHQHSLLYAPHQSWQQEISSGGNIKMRGNEVFREAVKSLGSVIEETFRKTNICAKDIDWLVPHQANIRIIEAMANKLDLPMQQVICTIAKHGNTSAASIPLALDLAVRDGRIQAGHHLLLAAFGGGFTWGTCYMQF